MSTERIHAIAGVMCCILVFGLGLQKTLGRQFPVLMVSSSACRNIERKQQDESCKINIEDVLQDKESNTSVVSRMVFSVLWGATYNDGRDIDKGGHPGIDIATAKGTPVYSIGPGKVIRSGFLQGYGNSITIEHLYQDTHIYSTYNHLNTREVNVGDIIKEGKKIGEVGNTGFTIGETGNHLDFQITKQNSPTHPYAYIDCSAGYRDAVQEGSCRDKMKQYTIDPLTFFQENGYHGSAQEEIIFTPDLEQLVQHEISHDTIPYGYQVQYPEQKKQYAPLQLTTQYDYIIDSDISVPQEGLDVGKLARLVVFMKDYGTKQDVSGELKKEITIGFDPNIVSVSPSSFDRIVGGDKSMFVRAKASGTTDIVVRYDGKEITRHTITIN